MTKNIGTLHMIATSVQSGSSMQRQANLIFLGQLICSDALSGIGCRYKRSIEVRDSTTHGDITVIGYGVCSASHRTVNGILITKQKAFKN